LNKENLASYFFKSPEATVLKFGKSPNDRGFTSKLNDADLRILAKAIKSAKNVQKLDIDCSRYLISLRKSLKKPLKEVSFSIGESN